jgi:hypothetical protein
MAEDPDQGLLEQDENDAPGAADSSDDEEEEEEEEEEEAAGGGIRQGRVKRDEVLQSFVRGREIRRNQRQH